MTTRNLTAAEFDSFEDAMMAIPVTWLIRPDGTVHAKITGIHGKDWFEQQIQELF